jgi:hypothetical protein
MERTYEENVEYYGQEFITWAKNWNEDRETNEELHELYGIYCEDRREEADREWTDEDSKREDESEDDIEEDEEKKEEDEVVCFNCGNRVLKEEYCYHCQEFNW